MNQLHIQGKPGVTAIIKIAVRRPKSKTTGNSAVSTIWQTAGMLRSETFYRSELKSVLAAGIDGMRVFKSVLVEPFIKFPVPQNFGTSSVGNAHHVGCVIKVRM